MNLSVTGLPAIAIEIGFIIVFAAPVWLAARLVKAKTPTFLRAVAALFLGGLGAFISVAVGGGFALLLGPVAFLLAFKYLLGTSFPGAIGLAIVAIAGYAAMLYFIGGGFHFGIDA